MTVPRATYRLQLRPGFGFDEVAGVAAYLRALGVSHVYLSPCLQAVAGSTHGYDVVDHSRVSDDLGGAEARARMLAALREHGLGQVIDIVPNHMAVATPDNRWWWDVLENGPSSLFAGHFDVEWRGADARRHDKVLLPILGDHYGRLLDAKQIRLERAGARVRVRVHDSQTLPVAPRSLALLLRDAASRTSDTRAELSFLADMFAELPDPGAVDAESVMRRHRDKDLLYAQLGRLLDASPEASRALEAAIAGFNALPEALHRVLEQQNYRLAFWRVGRHDFDYRRFFDIDTLIGLCVERPRVFEDSHELVLGWVEAGEVDGLRIDHPDGLHDPSGYFEHLRQRAPGAWIVIEKILSAGEVLPEAWPVDGTTGYDFLAILGALYVDASGERALCDLYDEWTKTRHPPFAELVHDKKRLVLQELLQSDLTRLTAQLVAICADRYRYRDYAPDDLREVLIELLACLPVYRTYLRDSGPASARDREVVELALGCARERLEDIDPRLLDLVGEILRGARNAPSERALAMRFQQLSGPAMAKGQEDTAFYCDHRLSALNEVGGEPAHFGASVEAFHAYCERIQRTHPNTMLASSTHDTKRSEDVRARIAVLSEIPERWARAARGFRRRGERHRGEVDAEIEYLFYQTWVGAYPISSERLSEYAIKAAREAKLHTSWLRPAAEYEEALTAFVVGALADAKLSAEVAAFVAEIEPAARLSSVCQLVLKLTAPGVPDIYQGNEVFRHDLTDPDNRRPVDFALLQAKLDALGGLGPRDVLEHEDPDLLKLFVTRRLLDVRAEQPEAFGARGDYRALAAAGKRADHVVAFARGDALVTVVPRHVLRLAGDWADTRVELPGGEFRDVFSGARQPGGERALAELTGAFPIAVLVR